MVHCELATEQRHGRNRCPLVEAAIGRPWYAPASYCERCDQSAESAPVVRAIRILECRRAEREAPALREDGRTDYTGCAPCREKMLAQMQEENGV